MESSGLKPISGLHSALGIATLSKGISALLDKPPDFTGLRLKLDEADALFHASSSTSQRQLNFFELGNIWVVDWGKIDFHPYLRPDRLHLILRPEALWNAYAR